MRLLKAGITKLVGFGVAIADKLNSEAILIQQPAWRIILPQSNHFVL
ncbi:hypothetical protein H6G76_35505 [Nostoc sp. FACHB-152]|nr:hypothetical protein [Nostoc sp. FACHB-152]